MQSLGNALAATLTDYLRERTHTPIHSPERDALLLQYRAAFTSQLHHDLAYNLSAIDGLARRVSELRHTDAMKLPVIADLFARLHASTHYLHETDAYSSSATEESCWLAIQQFYCDALELTERLVIIAETGRQRRTPRHHADGALQRKNFLGIEGYAWPQTIMRAVELTVPNPFHMHFVSTMHPTLRHLIRHLLIPWGGLTWSQLEATTFGWLGRHGFRRRASRRPPIRVRGMSRLLENAVLLDPQTRRSPHYLIIAASHRAGFLDFPFWSWPLRNLRHLTWVNNSFYGPGGARKLTRDRLTIPVRGFGKLPIHDAIELTIERMTQHGLPMFILADGSQPNMMYGHQVRIKRGLRLLVDECVRRGKPRGRRTFVLPLSFNDPVAFLRGFEPGIEVRFHPPIEITEPSSHQPHISVFDETAINGGDDLLNHLEALYLVNSMQPRHGLSTPDVLAAVRRKRAQLRRALRDHGKLTGHGLREALRARFYTTAMDMCGASVL